MAETMKDINVVANVGGTLTHFNGVSGDGGELTPYDSTPVGGPPEMNVDEDVRARMTFSVTTRVIGDTLEAREAFVLKFKRGTIFACKTNPVGSLEMHISGAPDAVGKDFVVMNANPSHSFQENSELTINLEELGPTA